MIKKIALFVLLLVAVGTVAAMAAPDLVEVIHSKTGKILNINQNAADHAPVLEETTVVCPSCGSEVDSSNTYCPVCGAPLPQ